MYAVRRKIEACKHTKFFVKQTLENAASRIETSRNTNHGLHITGMDSVGFSERAEIRRALLIAIGLALALPMHRPPP